MKDWAEILLAMLASNGILFFALKQWWAKKMKVLEYSHELEKDKQEHKQKMQIERSRTSLNDTLNKVVVSKNFLNRVHAKYRADYATIIKMSNGDKYGDGVHKWKFSATLESMNGFESGIFDELQLNPIEESGFLFAIVKEHGYNFVNIQKEKSKTTLSSRLEKKGVACYAVVSTPDVMNSLLLCWFKKEGRENGVNLSDVTLKQIMGEFRGMEDNLL